jgi:hypothetical protein
MTEQKPTIGRAIDQILEALGSFEERDQRTILSTVCAHLQMYPVANAPGAKAEVLRTDTPPTATTQSNSHQLPAPKTRHNVDIRTLKDQKKPRSARQMACLVAYYLQEEAPEDERKQAITTADVDKYFKQAGFKLPEKLEQLLADSKRSGYFESASRGAYKLTRVGYNLITHTLPEQATD